jgi:hypothetical protein
MIIHLSPENEDERGLVDNVLDYVLPSPYIHVLKHVLQDYAQPAEPALSLLVQPAEPGESKRAKKAQF